VSPTHPVTFVATDFNYKTRRVFRVDRLMHQPELALFYHPQPCEQFRFAFGEFLFRDLLELESHLQLEQLLLDHGVVVQLLIGQLLNLAEDELETVDRREK